VADAGPTDTLRPTLLNTSPMNGATEVPTGTQFVITFSEPMDIDSIEVGTLPAATPATPVWSHQDTVLTLQFETELAQHTAYTVTVDGDDLAGNPLAGTHSFSFTTTGSAPDITPPTVLAASPGQASVGNARNTHFEVVFSEPMNKASVQAAFSITAPTGFNGGMFSWNEAATVMAYTPPASFAYGAEISWQVATSATDAAGNALAEPLVQGLRVIRQGAITLAFDLDTSGSVSAPSYFRPSNVYGSAYLGDDSINDTYRLFLGFKLTGLPEDLTGITQASLRWWMSQQIGNPFGKFGALLLEPVNVGNRLETAHANDPPAPALIADYHTEPLAAGARVPSSAIGAPGSLDVTSFVSRDWSNRASRDRRTQFRLRFEQVSDRDGQMDALLSDAETHPTLAELYVVYEYP
jgi:hypothetical protein